MPTPTNTYFVVVSLDNMSIMFEVKKEFATYSSQRVIYIAHDHTITCTCKTFEEIGQITFGTENLTFALKSLTFYIKNITNTQTLLVISLSIIVR